MALGTTNISTDLVGTTLGTSSRDVGTLCRHDNVNKWSRYKPVNGEYLHPTCGFIITSTTDQRPNALRNYVWSYDKPTGGQLSPFRLGDFRGYDHIVRYADKPFGVSVSYPTVGGTLSISCDFGQTTNATLASPRYMPLFADYYFGVSVYKGTTTYDLVHVISKCGLNKIGSNSGELIQIDTSTLGFTTGEIYMVIPFVSEMTFTQSTGATGGAGNANKYNLNAVSVDSGTIMKNIGTPTYPFFFSDYAYQQTGSYGVKVSGRLNSNKETNSTSVLVKIEWTLYSDINGGGSVLGTQTAITVGYYDVPRFGYAELPQTTVTWDTGLSVKSIKVRYIIPSTLTDTYQTYNMTL